ncbi:hypothetical protein EFT44_10045 [Leuconostoc falkenbergense]|uniref:protein-export chaperone SecB n=1 Tax=Leuconostoc falkenbergense TaxID=2766470 RepID=UPI0021AA8A49|nr:protein-export chaperone SecB [Leuconostoc falkenbergense]MCT4411884.1 hypothetical protein [Leuconostoc falkenbergense]
MAEEQVHFKFSNPQLSGAMMRVLDRDISDEPAVIIKQVKISSNVTNKEDQKAQVSLTVANFDDVDDLDDKPYVFTVTYTSEFSWSEDVEEKNVEAFLTINAPALLLSYVRNTVSNLTSSAKVERLDLPFYDFTSSNN